MPVAGQSRVQVQTGSAGPAGRRVKFARLVVLAIFRLVFRLRVVGQAQVPRRPVIICVNHLGWTDAFLVLLLLPAEPRIYVLGERAGVLRDRLHIWVIRTLEIMIPLDRDKPREALRVMADVLARGGSLIIFPEGQLGTVEGTIGPLQPGAAHLSLQTGVPLLPVGLTGTRELWLRRRLTVRIGPPIAPA
ncbi:MAG TPA: lysophospholipid acyltransferase family protein, partial [Chloroflexia bacterium]|nr:lysophospholipid acyltransferase family protein [Chloroflexia bacterium]